MSNNKNKQSDGNVVFTHPDWVDKTIAIARQYTDTEIFIDPCAGGGAFIDGLHRAGLKSEGYDIVPARPDIVQQDFYETELLQHPAITNPPFTKGFAIEVFNQFARAKAPLIIMFWPASYRKWSMHDKLDNNYERLHSEVHPGPQKFFVGPHKKDTFNMCIEVWRRLPAGETRAKITPKGIPKTLELWKYKNVHGAPVPADVKFKFTHSGYSCGKLMAVKPGERFPINTYWYLRANTPDWILKALRTQDWSYYYNNVCQIGNKSLALPEINYVLDGLQNEN
jgi:hypothetical protein